MTTPYDPAKDGAQMAFDGRMSYGDYLHLNAILNKELVENKSSTEVAAIWYSYHENKVSE